MNLLELNALEPNRSMLYCHLLELSGGVDVMHTLRSQRYFQFQHFFVVNPYPCLMKPFSFNECIDTCCRISGDDVVCWNPMKRRRTRRRGWGGGMWQRRRKSMMKTRSGMCTVTADACNLWIRLPSGGDWTFAAVAHWIVHCHHQTETVKAHQSIILLQWPSPTKLVSAFLKSSVSFAPLGLYFTGETKPF